jgi:hypothetical protein
MTRCRGFVELRPCVRHKKAPDNILIDKTGRLTIALARHVLNVGRALARHVGMNADLQSRIKQAGSIVLEEVSHAHMAGSGCESTL